MKHMNGIDKLRQGDTWTFSLSKIVDVTGQAVSDLTGWSARVTMRPKRSAEAVLQEAGVPGNGQFDWEVDSEATSLIVPRPYFLDVELTDPEGRRSTPFETVVTVTPDNSE